MLICDFEWEGKPVYIFESECYVKLTDAQAVGQRLFDEGYDNAIDLYERE